MSNSYYPCRMCTFVANSFRKYWKHLKQVHSQVTQFHVTCNIYSCKSTFTKLNSFYRHIRRSHETFYKDYFAKTDGRMPLDNEDVLDNFAEYDDSGDITEDVETVAHNHEDNMEHLIDFEEYISTFLLELREFKKVSGEACSFVAIELAKIVELVWTLKSREVIKKLSELDIVNEDLNSFVLREEENITRICRHFSYMKNLDSYIVRNDDGNLVSPVEINLGWNTEKQRFDTFQYVPILKTLSVMLQKEDVLSYLLADPEKDSDDICSFSDGSIFKENELFSDKNALQISLYSDDFVPVNPLGHKQRNYKITSFYFVLGNLHRKYRSQLKFINLVLLCPAVLVAKYGYGSVLTPLIRDLEVLESEGVKVTVDNHCFTFLGTISLLIGDNLAAHALGGFMESFGPNVKKVCRYCNGNRELINRCFEDSCFEKRSMSSYDNQVFAVEAASSYSSVYGIKSRSVFNVLSYFHVVGRQPFDIFHDIYEGFGVDVLSHVIEHYVRNNVFSFEIINTRIDNFHYAAFERSDKPQHIQKNSTWENFRLHQKAVEMSNLIRLLPLLLGDLVPEDDSVWAVLVSFIQLVQHLSAPVFHAGECAYLSIMIAEFLTTFFDVFQCNVKPKAHFLIHYPAQILETGPPIDHDTVRFEGKHNHFKEVYNRSKNRINIVKTLSIRHQFYMYLHHRKQYLLAPNEPECTFSEEVRVSMLTATLQRAIKEVTTNDIVTLAKSAKFEGQLYDEGCAVPVLFSNDTFQFACIQHIFFIGDILYLLCLNLETIGFNLHYNSYEVISSDGYTIYTIPQLLDFHPLGMYMVEGIRDCSMIPLKYHLRKE